MPDGNFDFSSLADSNDDDEELDEDGFPIESSDDSNDSDDDDEDVDEDGFPIDHSSNSDSDDESISFDDDDDSEQSFVTPAGTAPTVAMPTAATTAPEETEVFPQAQPEAIPPKDNKTTKIFILIAIVLVFIIGFIGVYKYVLDSGKTSSQSATPTTTTSATPSPSTSSPSQSTSESTSVNGESSTLSLETQAPNITNISQAMGIVQEKHIYTTDGQRFYALVFTVSNVSQPMIVFVPADTYSKVNDGDKYQIVYGQYADGMLGIRSLSSSVAD